jgi:hypothetical protein
MNDALISSDSLNSFVHLKEVGPWYWTLRTSFVLFHLIDIGNHMSFLRLNNGKFLVVDACTVSPEAKKEIDRLTNNGALIEAVVASHAFHTLGFPPFFALYPSPPYYGTSRHRQMATGIPWVGDITKEENLNRWVDQGIQIRIPAGTDLLSNSHFAGIFVFHVNSRTIHLDDTFNFFETSEMVGCLRCLLYCTGVSFNRVRLHPKAFCCDPKAPGGQSFIFPRHR